MSERPRRVNEVIEKLTIGEPTEMKYEGLPEPVMLGCTAIPPGRLRYDGAKELKNGQVSMEFTILPVPDDDPQPDAIVEP